jgi:hypothetical protein
MKIQSVQSSDDLITIEFSNLTKLTLPKQGKHSNEVLHKLCVPLYMEADFDQFTVTDDSLVFRTQSGTKRVIFYGKKHPMEHKKLVPVRLTGSWERKYLQKHLPLGTNFKVLIDWFSRVIFYDDKLLDPETFQQMKKEGVLPQNFNNIEAENLFIDIPETCKTVDQFWDFVFSIFRNRE